MPSSVAPADCPSSKNENNVSKPGCLKRFNNFIVDLLETGFYKVGTIIGRWPVVFIVGSLVITGLFAVAIPLTLKEATKPEELWVNSGAEILTHNDWVKEHFPTIARVATIIVTADNVLTPAAINAAFAIYKESLTISTNDGIKLGDICIKIGANCLTNSLLELWSFNETTVQSLTQLKIINTVNTVTNSPIYRNTYDITTVLGQQTTNSTGLVTGAKAMLMIWYLQGQDSILSNTTEWELKFVELGQKIRSGVHVYVNTRRSINDEAMSAVNNNIVRLSSGYVMLIIFVTLVLGKFNMVEQRVWMSFAGILGVGQSIAVSYGFSSLCGVEYTQLHSILPFLLLGIGVDDMFVIVSSLNNLQMEEVEVDIPHKVGKILKHAGLSVTVTSFTDIVSFGIGATTVLPALRSFCIYAAVGVLALYFYQTVFFTACLTLDLRRASSVRDACCCCYTHKHWHPNRCSHKEVTTWVFKKIIGPFLSKLPAKICVVLSTLGLFGAGIYGFINLKQEFDFLWFLPSDSYSYAYFDTSSIYFPDTGALGSVYCGQMDYFNSRSQFEQLYTELNTNQDFQTGTVDSWFKAFTDWLNTTSDAAVMSQLDGNKYPKTEADFVELLFSFVNNTETRLSRYINFSNATGGSVLSTRISFQHTTFDDSQSEVRAMDNARSMINNIFGDGHCFPHSRRYQDWETNKVIQVELYRNLGLTCGSVFLVTLILIANFWTCLMVFLCVGFTLVNVTGGMFFWGLTVDTITSIILIIAIGLSVDYSAHVGHMFMTVKGSKQERMLETLREMGPPVFNGGFSTLLAFILLASSNSYVFTTFFKVFLLVVVYGLFHGLIFLPVLLSWFGPSPYISADREFHLHEEEVDPAAVNHDYELSTISGNISNHESGMNESLPYIPPPDYSPCIPRWNNILQPA